MRANLNSLGDGVIVLGLGAFLLSVAIVYAQSAFSSPSSSFNAVLAGFFALSLALVIAGILKIANAFYGARDEKVSTLKTAVIAFIVGFIPLYSSIFLLRFPFL